MRAKFLLGHINRHLLGADTRTSSTLTVSHSAPQSVSRRLASALDHLGKALGKRLVQLLQLLRGDAGPLLLEKLAELGSVLGSSLHGAGLDSRKEILD